MGNIMSIDEVSLLDSLHCDGCLVVWKRFDWFWLIGLIDWIVVDFS